MHACVGVQGSGWCEHLFILGYCMAFWARSLPLLPRAHACMYVHPQAHTPVANPFPPQTHTLPSSNPPLPLSLHRNSPLGETILECYNTGSRNVFALGFVPLKDENTVVLLSRDTPQNATAIKDLNIDMGQVGNGRGCMRDGLHPSTGSVLSARSKTKINSRR
jgi:hypothetical protein